MSHWPTIIISIFCRCTVCSIDRCDALTNLSTSTNTTYNQGTTQHCPSYLPLPHNYSTSTPTNYTLHYTLHTTHYTITITINNQKHEFPRTIIATSVAHCRRIESDRRSSRYLCRASSQGKTQAHLSSQCWLWWLCCHYQCWKGEMDEVRWLDGWSLWHLASGICWHGSIILFRVCHILFLLILTTNILTFNILTSNIKHA